MGKWNRRYFPRRNFRNYEYEDPPPSPPPPHDTSFHSSSSGIGNNWVPSWEIDYCNAARVPWRKILASKKYIYSYPTVLDWDACAGEEALQNAKQRYWAAINGLPCDNPLPDPDMYVEEIDWNPYMDPELMAELELQAFDPDKTQGVGSLETIEEGVEFAQSQYDKNQSSNDNNPWEKDQVQGTESMKDTMQGGWSRWDESVNPKNDNPWEQSCSDHVESFKDNAWKSGNESWGWPQGIDKSPDFVNCNINSNHTRQEGWGRRGDDSRGRGRDRGRGRGNSNDGGFKNFGNSGYARGSYFSTGSKERGWGDNGNESWNQRESGWQGNEQKNMGSWSFERGGMPSGSGGFRKREGFQQNSLKFKSTRCHVKYSSCDVCGPLMDVFGVLEDEGMKIDDCPSVGSLGRLRRRAFANWRREENH